MLIVLATLSSKLEEPNHLRLQNNNKMNMTNYTVQGNRQ